MALQKERVFRDNQAGRHGVIPLFASIAQPPCCVNRPPPYRDAFQPRRCEEALDKTVSLYGMGVDEWREQHDQQNNNVR
jgi:hypothetical protein